MLSTKDIKEQCIVFDGGNKETHPIQPPDGVHWRCISVGNVVVVVVIISIVVIVVYVVVVVYHSIVVTTIIAIATTIITFILLSQEKFELWVW